MFARKRQSSLPTSSSNDDEKSSRLEKDNPHDAEKVTFKQRIKQYGNIFWSSTFDLLV